MRKFIRNILLTVLLAGAAFPLVAAAARTSVDWVNPSGTSYIQPNFGINGMDLLIFGSNHYINFNAITGSSGYGFRDNAGVMEFKNSGGSWTGIGSGSGGGGSGNVATSTAETSGYFPSWATTNGTPAKLSGTSLIFTDGTHVGIGTASPSQPLTVNGAILSNLELIAPSSFISSYFPDAANLQTFFNNSSVALLTLNGVTTNVGVATTTPGSIFSIGNLSSTAGINFSMSTSTFSNTGGINLTTGCYSINGVCVGGSSASTTLLGDNNTFSGTDVFNNTITGSVSGSASSINNVHAVINTVPFSGLAAITITAASSTLLGDSSIFSGHNVFSASTTINAQLNAQQASTTNFTASGNIYGSIFHDTSGAQFQFFSGTNQLDWSAANELSANGGNLGDFMFTWTNGWINLVHAVSATTTNLYVTGVKSALHLGDSNGQVIAYTGTSPCSANQAIVSISALGVGSCSSTFLTSAVTSVGAVWPLSSTGGNTPVISSATSSASSAGVLSAADWTTFNSKLSANQTITLSGDITGSGATSISTTLATVNSNVGSFGGVTSIPTFTVNGKGLLTAAGAVTPSIPVGDITGTLPIGNGGTGLSAVGASSTVAVTNGTSIAWQKLDLGATVYGILPTANGGTGSANLGTGVVQSSSGALSAANPTRSFIIGVASTTVLVGSTTSPVFSFPFGLTVTSWSCNIQPGGAAAEVEWQYANPTAYTTVTPTYLAASTTPGIVAISSNNTPTAAATSTLIVGNPTGSALSGYCTFVGNSATI